MSRRTAAGRRYHLGSRHLLAEVARQHCANRHAPGSVLRVGGVACGECWELAIRDDEQIVVEHGLPREIEPDPAYVDEIAVDLACRGERVSLTPADRAAAVARLSTAGRSVDQIATRLRMSTSRVVLLLTAPQSPAVDFDRPTEPSARVALATAA
jgi:hypothetical protein